VLRRFDFGAKAVNIGGVRLVHKKGKGVRAEKYGDPQLIAEIKTALERKLREALGEEQWRDHVKITEGGRRLVVTHQLLQRLTQDPNTAKTLKTATAVVSRIFFSTPPLSSRRPLRRMVFSKAQAPAPVL